LPPTSFRTSWASDLTSLYFNFLIIKI
jgi:hypothetical protein